MPDIEQGGGGHGSRHESHPWSGHSEGQQSGEGQKPGDAAAKTHEGSHAALSGAQILADHAKEVAAGSASGKNASPKFEAPTRDQLNDQATKGWDAWKKGQDDNDAREARDVQEGKRPPSNNMHERGEESREDFVKSRLKADMDGMGKLSDNDLKTVGAVADALSKPGGVEKASALLSQAFDKGKYDEDKMFGLDLALNNELTRRGMDNKWEYSVAYGPDGAHAQLQDKSVNLAAHGTQWLTYTTELKKQ
jgi:hypothetical protein